MTNATTEIADLTVKIFVEDDQYVIDIKDDVYTTRVAYPTFRECFNRLLDVYDSTKQELNLVVNFMLLDDDADALINEVLSV